MRDRVWASYIDLKFKGYVLSLLLDKYQRLDRRINTFLALASSGSIAAWAIWKDYPMIWACIIALSQVINAVKPYFPYFKYVKELNSKCHKTSNMIIDYEDLWYKSEYKRLSEDEVHEIHSSLKKSSVDILNFNDEIIFNVSNKMEKKANEKMQTFLQNHYNISIDINKK